MGTQAVIKISRADHLTGQLTLVEEINDFQNYAVYALIAGCRNEINGVELIHPLGTPRMVEETWFNKFSADEYISRLNCGPVWYKNVFYIERKDIDSLHDVSVLRKFHNFGKIRDENTLSIVDGSEWNDGLPKPDWEYLEVDRVVDIRCSMLPLTDIILKHSNIYGKHNVVIEVAAN